VNICLVGYGAMGHVVADSISSDDIISGIVAPGYNENFEGIESDVIIDFSHHSNIFKIHEYVTSSKKRKIRRIRLWQRKLKRKLIRELQKL